MKVLPLFIFISLFFVSPVLHAESDDHEHAKVGGPKGGRLLEHTQPQAEFFLEKDRSVIIAFYNDEMNSVPVEEQAATLVIDKDGTKTKIEFEKREDVLVSKGQLPEGSPNLVLQFKQTPAAKPSNFRFALEESICGECKRAEYACICSH